MPSIKNRESKTESPLSSDCITKEHMERANSRRYIWICPLDIREAESK